MRPMPRLALTFALALLSLARGADPAGADGAGVHTLYVAPRDTPAFAAAQAKAGAGAADRVHATLHKALAQAADLALQPGTTEVAVLVASGSYAGKAGAGGWALPTLNAPAVRLLLLGGWSDDWAGRDPFRKPSLIGADASSGTPVLELGKKTALKEVVVSGFVVDYGGRNAYDADGNLKREGSRGAAFVAFQQAQLERVVLADNVLLNSGGRVVEPLIAAASKDAEIVIRNNLFWNDCVPVQVGQGLAVRGLVVRRIVLQGNTFLRCWPYNPDPTSGEVGAVSLNTKESAQEIVVRDNLFAHNVGGAFQHDWPEERMPRLSFTHNLFFGNASLLGATEPGAGMIVGKFGTNPRYLVLDAARVGDDFAYEVKDAVALDPGLPADGELAVTPAEGGEGHDVEVKGFAPRVTYDPARLPLPRAPEAAPFGIQPGAVTPR